MWDQKERTKVEIWRRQETSMNYFITRENIPDIGAPTAEYRTHTS